MGPLFVIFFWGLIATMFAVVSAALVWLGQHRRARNVRRRRAVLAAALPFITLLWMLPASLLWRGWGMLTGLEVQSWSFDSWEVGLPNGYVLGFIDVSDEASIYVRGGGEALVPDITQIAVQGDLVFGITQRGPFVFDTSGKKSQHDFAALTARVPLMPVGDYPGIGRPQTVLDGLLFCVILLLPPLLLARRWWSPRQRSGTYSPAGL